MKHLYYALIRKSTGALILLFVFKVSSVLAQAPQAFKYQAVIRDSVGVPLQMTPVSIQISIVKDAIEIPPGEIVYTEIHDTITNSGGLVSLNIGQGNVQGGVFNTIAWGLSDFFIRIDVKLEGSISFIHLGSSQLLSVPYALYAKEAGGPPTYTWEQLTGTGKTRQDNEPGKMVYVSNRNQMAYYDGYQWVLLVGCPPLTEAYAGNNQLDIIGTEIQLAANQPKKGNTGTWTVLNGNGNTGYFSDINDSTAIFTGIPGRAYTLIWTIATVCESNSDTITVSFCHTLTIADAGPDHFGILDTYKVLEGNEPGIGNSGQWTVEGNGGAINNPIEYNAGFTGEPGETYTLTWTIQSDCESSSDEVVISFCHTLTNADAGPDILNVNGTSTQLQANPAGTGNSGHWTVIQGTGGHFDDITDPETFFYGEYNSLYLLLWTLTADCDQISQDTVTISFCPYLVQALAGSDVARICDSYILQGNEPGIGNIALWEITNGTGGLLTNPGSPNAILTGQPGSTYSLTYTISNPCGSSSDQISVGFEALPSLANAGPDQLNINDTIAIIQANAPEHGSGLWSVFSGIGGSFLNETDTLTEFYGQPNETYKLCWTIINQCNITESDYVLVSFCPVLVQANAGEDTVRVCNPHILQGNEKGEGNNCNWIITAGEGGLLTNPGSPNATITGQPGVTYSLTYTISNACGSSSDQVSVGFEALPSQAHAGTDQFNISDTVVILQADPPQNGVGHWSVYSGFGGSFLDETQASTSFYGKPNTTYKLVWTITNLCNQTSSDTIFISFCPIFVQANAGPDVPVACRPHLLQGNSPGTGSVGLWSVISGTTGCTFSNVSDPNALFYGIPGNTYILQWEFSNSCHISADTITITFEHLPTAALAGPDQLNVEGNTVVLQANTPATGAGTWSIVSGLYGNIISVNNPQSMFIGVVTQTYMLEWKISNTCYDSADTVNISFLAPFICGDTLVDERDSFLYPTLKLGNQCWMSKNMNLGIGLSWGQSATDNGTIEKMCYNYADSNCDTYGGLYTWDEAMNYSLIQGSRGICPPGWHIPTESEWNILITYLGGSSIAGGKAKETGFLYWMEPNTGATNSSGLSVRGAGFYDNSFQGLKTSSFIWSSRRIGDNGRMVMFGNNDEMMTVNSSLRSRYKSVRCLKD